MFKPSNIFADVQGPLLADPTGVRWSTATLSRYVIDALRYIVRAKPEAASTTVLSNTLAAGAQQTLSAAVQASHITLYGAPYMLLDVVEAEDGSTIERIARSEADRQVPNWQKLIPAAAVPLYWMQDEHDAQFFYLCPKQPSSAQGKVRMRVSFMSKEYGTNDDIQLIGDEWRSTVAHYTAGKAMLLDQTFSNERMALLYLGMVDRDLGLEEGATARTLRRRVVQEQGVAAALTSPMGPAGGS